MNYNLRNWLQIVEGRDAPLYHGCSFYAAIQMLKSDRIDARTVQNPHALRRLTEPTEGVSLSRSYQAALMFGSVVIRLDQRRMAQRYRILPIDYWGVSNEVELLQARRQGKYAEAEEFVVGPVDPLSDVLQAILISSRRSLEQLKRKGLDDAAILLQHPLFKVS